MVLSRIWSVFILLSVVVATFFYFSKPNGKTMYSQMITGKSGDTTLTKTVDSLSLSKTIIQQVELNAVYKKGNYRVIKSTDKKYISYYEQNADGVLATAKTAVELSIGLIGIMALFMGFMRIAESAGGIRFLSRLIWPFFSRLFPEVPKGHESMGHMMLNFSANLLGLDNAATPFGIKAMQSLQELNPTKTTASNAQIMFLCLHASGLTLIPVSIIALRSKLDAANPTDIFIPCLIATFTATVAAMTIVGIKQRINLFQPIILLWIGGISLFLASIIWYASTLSKSSLELFSGTLSNGIILLLFVAIIVGALWKKVAVFDEFVEGAKNGFDTAIKIIPYLVGMLIAISLLRTSGTFDLVMEGFRWVFSNLGADTQFVDGLPTAMIKPLSGSGARGMMVDTMTAYGPDSFQGRLACILQGSSDTTFYVIAVYFGAVSIKNIRYSVGAMLLADLVGIITAITVCYLWFA